MFQSLADRLVGAFTKSDSVPNQEKSGNHNGALVAKNDTSLFDLLTPDLLLIIFQYVGLKDKKTFIQLASCSDENLSKFIYKDCGLLLWKELDLSQFRGITDKQLSVLLEKVNAQQITTSLVLDKNSKIPIKGTGLEPLRHSRVLTKIDLRQSESMQPGATGLNDQVVSSILSTMLPHALSIVKVRKQRVSQDGNTLFSQYCFAWSLFFNNFKLSQAQKHASHSCSHCTKTSLAPQGNFAVLQVLESSFSKCDKCQQYTCRPWNPASSGTTCPSLQECDSCLEWHCSCRATIDCAFCNSTTCTECEQNAMTCPTCTVQSCSRCSSVKQCTNCQEIGCEICRGDIWDCSRCNGTYCGTCRFVGDCYLCRNNYCSECLAVTFCSFCDRGICDDCNFKNRNSEVERDGLCVLSCNACEDTCCNGCSKFWIGFEKCQVCGQGVCKDEDCASLHDCKPVGELVYKVRDAQAGDDAGNLCFCGKKHLSNPSGQQFICAWRRRYKRRAKRARLRK